MKKPILFGDYSLCFHLPRIRELLNHEGPLLHLYKQVLSLKPGILRTPTSLWNRAYLRQHKLEDHLEALHTMSVNGAKQCIQHSSLDCVLAGAIGSLPDPQKKLTPSDMKVLFSEPAVYLSDLNIDCFLMEGFEDLQQFQICVETLQRVSQIPIAAFFRFREPKDWEKIPSLLEIAKNYVLDLIGFQMTESLYLQYPEGRFPLEGEKSFGLQIDLDQILSTLRQEEVAEKIKAVQPTMILGGEGWKREDWFSFLSLLKK